MAFKGYTLASLSIRTEIPAVSIVVGSNWGLAVSISLVPFRECRATEDEM